ncbi:MAG: sulfotransferase family protein [Anaerolineae bacterium]
MCKPNFFIVGSAKAGTTAMYEFLKNHPDVFLPARKEINYFGSNLTHTIHSTAVRNEEEYLLLYKGWKAEKIIGDTSTNYLYDKSAAEEIYQFNPQSYIIIMLRNPVDVMYSLYYQMCFNGNEDIESFEEALAAEEVRKQGQRLPKNMRIQENLYYRERVKFANQVLRYKNTFPAEQIMIFLQEDLRFNPVHTFRQVLTFLQIDTNYHPDFRLFNPNKEVRSSRLRKLYTNPLALFLSKQFPNLGQSVYQIVRNLNTIHTPRPPMNSDLRQRLLEEYTHEIDTLSQIIDRDLTHWYQKES